MGGDGGVPDERRLLACIEEAQPQVVVGAVGGEHEGHLGMRKLARDALQRGIALAVGIENHGRRVAGKTRASECIDLENAQLPVSKARWRSFARIGASGYTSMNLGVVFARPETRGIDYPIPANPLNLTRVMPA